MRTEQDIYAQAARIRLDGMHPGCGLCRHLLPANALDDNWCVHFLRVRDRPEGISMLDSEVGCPRFEAGISVWRRAAGA